MEKSRNLQALSTSSALITDVELLFGDLDLLMLHGIDRLSNPEGEGVLHVIDSNSVQVVAPGLSASIKIGVPLKKLIPGDTISVKDIKILRDSADLFVFGDENVLHGIDTDFFRVLEFLSYITLDKEI